MAADDPRRRNRKLDPVRRTASALPWWAWPVIGAVLIVGSAGLIFARSSDEDAPSPSANATAPPYATAIVVDTFQVIITGDSFDLTDVKLPFGNAARHNPEREPVPIAYQATVLLTAESGPQSQRIQGSTPQTLTLHGRAVSISVQKQRQMGRLKVELLRNGSVVKASETTADYGVVSVSTN